MSTDKWREIIPYVQFRYNCLHIPGTQISPYMLVLGKQPTLPTDAELMARFPRVSQSRKEYLTDLLEKLRSMEKLVARAHLAAQRKQRYSYDAEKLDVQYSEGDRVLLYHPKVRNKLCQHWSGPYLIEKRLNPVAYWIRDELNPSAEPRRASIRHLAPAVLSAALEDTPSAHKVTVESPEVPPGKFIVFRRPQSRPGTWMSQLHVAEIFQPFEQNRRLYWLHHYRDFGPRAAARDYDPTQPLGERKVRPVFTIRSTGHHVVQGHVATNSEPFVEAVAPHEIEILAPPFDLFGLRVPKTICQQVYARLKENRPATRSQRSQD